MALPATMRAVSIVQPGSVVLDHVPVPRPAPGEVLVRVEAALTCGTDLKTFLRGHARLPVPSPFGHEFAGVIAATGSGVSAFTEGDAVMCVPTAPCDACDFCVRRRENLCAATIDRMVLGAYAEYVLLPRHIVDRHLFRRPPSLAAEAAAALEPLSCVVHGASRIDWSASPDTAIVGDGAIALLFARVALLCGAARVLVVGRHPDRLRVARHYGADAVLAPDARSAADGVAAWAERGAPDVVIECAGTAASWRQASDLAGAGGRVLLFGGCAAGTEVCFNAFRMHYEEVDLLGAFHYTPRAVRKALAMLADGQVDPLPLITQRLPLHDVQHALQLMQERRAIKVALIP